MGKLEKIPLLPAASTNYSSGYLLLTVPQNEDRSIITQSLKKLGNYCGTIAAVSATLLLILIILSLTSRADISEITSGSNQILRASAPTAQNLPNSQVLETPLGKLKGYTRRSRKGREYLAFYKVPYAKPPIGDLRFKDPQHVNPWVGIREFDEVAPSCIQKSKHTQDNVITGEEDCLYSNIFVPATALNTTEGFPIMVYLHGGGFGDGNGSRFGAEYFMDENVVLVIFEYRLGLFGFLNTGDREATGNMGFKDQVMLLKWVKDYIKYFKGDPSCVTIFGNSAGGFSVSFLMISPMSKGLFHRAISQSGTVLTESTTVLDLKPEITKKAAAAEFNCSLVSSNELLDCLRRIDAKDLCLVKSPDIKYALTVESGFDPNDLSNVFMPDKPYSLLKAGKVNSVPYIMGVGSTEWIGASLVFLTNDDFINNLNANFSYYAPKILGMTLSTEESQAIQSFYFNGKLISNETERNLTNLLSDRIMVHGTKATADFHSQISDTYLYLLSKRPAKSYSDKMLVNYPSINTTNAVAHADEIQFLFPYFGYPEYPVSDTAYFPFSELFVKLWAQFATTGKPRIDGELMDWNPVTVSTDSTQGTSASIWYELNDKTGPTLALQERMRFWDQFSHEKLMYEQ